MQKTLQYKGKKKACELTKINFNKIWICFLNFYFHLQCYSHNTQNETKRKENLLKQNLIRVRNKY